MSGNIKAVVFQPDDDEWYRRQFKRERWSLKSIALATVIGALFVTGVILILFFPLWFHGD